jgi:hypothetical protein
MRYFQFVTFYICMCRCVYMRTHKHTHSRVSFCDASFYDGSLVRHLPSRTEHSRLVVHHCRNSSTLSIALLALFLCACVSCLSILVQFFQVDCNFSTHDDHQKHRLPSFAKKDWKQQGRLTLETKRSVNRKMDSGEKSKLKLNVIM